MTTTTSQTPPGATSEEAYLVLEDGTVHVGRAWGARGETLGEIVFSTGMTGYQETLTDPSYHKQIVVMTAPHVGNTGVNGEDPESGRIWVSGFVVRDPARRASSWRSERSLDAELEAQGIVGIRELDTRALTRHLRTAGAMRAGVFSGDAVPAATGPSRVAELLERVRSSSQMVGADLADEVTTASSYVVEPEAGTDPVGTVVAVDLGIKDMTPHRMAERGLRVVVVPSTSTLADIQAHEPDAVFFSNGPGDPAAADDAVELLRGVLDAGIPYFGICFGNQILGRALGFGTYKLTFGHRGINQPVKDVRTGKVEITAHNHGFAVDAPIGQESVAPHDGGRYGRVIVSHVGLNDDVVEGLECLDIPAFSVQYHPEAAAGPHDAAYLFDRLVELVTSHGAIATNATDDSAAPDGSTAPEENA
ncbi:glutamine-hydrolyzing carbamoyl-phosphate synthase small subunit [Miniimonas arenae]|uniref:glutamine-hydrolyzing carbamoyl-phosphate synthase small subunit n=1 Tax=Miniimonas arenae TaxID=676201 RepID=UPI0028A7CD51|nr:glutamine-hydrolyzing carbamoyl-phosphate synthase small subunit [Miniimonas arenae]